MSISKKTSLLNPEIKCLDSYYCTFYQYINGYCSYSSYQGYCNEQRLNKGCCNYYGHQVYLGNIFSCTKDKYYYKHLCIYERNKSKYKYMIFLFWKIMKIFNILKGK